MTHSTLDTALTGGGRSTVTVPFLQEGKQRHRAAVTQQASTTFWCLTLILHGGGGLGSLDGSWGRPPTMGRGCLTLHSSATHSHAAQASPRTHSQITACCALPVPQPRSVHGHITHFLSISAPGFSLSSLSVLRAHTYTPHVHSYRQVSDMPRPPSPPPLTGPHLPVEPRKWLGGSPSE